MTTSSRSGAENPRTISALLDASALLAFFLGEPGSDQVAALTLDGTAAISTVNLAEVAGVLRKRGVPPSLLQETILRLNIRPLVFSESQALAAASLIGLRGHSRRGLSLGDRACIATAADLGVVAVTADREWATLDLPASVALIR